MKVFITGATGFVGHSLALYLAQKGHSIHVLARNPLSDGIPNHENITVFKGDITCRNTLVQALNNCESVYHTAALVRPWAKDAAQFYKINVEGTRNVLAESLKQGVKKLVFTSSCGVLGPSLNTPVTESDPRNTGFENDYEFSKLLAENLVKEYYHAHGLSTVIVSPSKVYGHGIDKQPISINRIITNYLKGRIIFIPKPASFIGNYCFIDDVIEGHVLAMEKGKAGEKYILGGENLSYAELFQKLRTISGTRAIVIPVPQQLISAAARIQYLKCRISGTEPFLYCKRGSPYFLQQGL